MKESRDLEIWGKVNSYQSFSDFKKKFGGESALYTFKDRGMDIDLLLKNKKSENLVICFNGAIPRAKRDSIKFPIFSGTYLLSDVNCSVLSLSDPYLTLADDLTLAWYVGKQNSNFQQFYVELISHIIEKLNIKKVIFFGGSGGGFASLNYSQFFDNSYVVAFNPQVNIEDYYVPHMINGFSKACFNVPLLKDVDQKIKNEYRINLNDVYTKKLNNNVVYIQNFTDLHFQLHAIPFANTIGMSVKETEGIYEHPRALMLVGDWQNGHDPLPKVLLKKVLISVINAKVFDDVKCELKADKQLLFKVDKQTDVLMNEEQFVLTRFQKILEKSEIFLKAKQVKQARAELVKAFSYLKDSSAAVPESLCLDFFKINIKLADLDLSRVYHRNAAISYLRAFDLKASEFDWVLLIKLANCIYLSGIGYARLDEVTQFFFAKINKMGHISEGEKLLRKMRMYTAIGDYDNAFAIYKNSPEFESNVAYRSLALDIAKMLYFQGEYGYLSKFLEVNARWFNAKEIKDYRDSCSYMPNIHVKNIIDNDVAKITSFSQKNKSKALLITFGHLFTHKESLPYGVNIFAKQDYDIIHVAQMANSCYQTLSFTEFEKIIAPLAKGYQRIFMYGSSLGAYASLYYAGSVNAYVIGMSPRNPVHVIYDPMKYMPIEDHDVEFRHEPDIANIPKTNKKVFLVHDPKDSMDQQYYVKQTQPNFHNVEIMELPYTGHPTTIPLAKSGLLKTMLVNIMERLEMGVEVQVDEFDYDVLCNKLKEAKYAKNIQKITEYRAIIDQKYPDKRV